ncbi:uncharacterized protein LOC134350030 [Mobula hypostoma]|uniref:uncharacterized protein LOC134350030 n=1 Tax=Mobula hypostoma TaxID=723540 RepID=UPI002FC2EEED
MAPPSVLGAETWAASAGACVVTLDVICALSLLLLILLVISCGNCMRNSSQFSTDRNYTEYTEGKSQLIRVVKLDDDEQTKITCKPTLTEGSLHSRKVSWQNDVQVPGTLSPELPHAPAPQSRALPDIPTGPVGKEDTEGKGDPIYQTASELDAPSQGAEEDPKEQPYMASSQPAPDVPMTDLIVEEEEEGGRSASGKVTAVYARVSKKVKNPSDVAALAPCPPPGELEQEELPPPIPEKLFSDGEIGGSPGDQSWGPDN